MSTESGNTAVLKSRDLPPQMDNRHLHSKPASPPSVDKAIFDPLALSKAAEKQEAGEAPSSTSFITSEPSQTMPITPDTPKNGQVQLPKQDGAKVVVGVTTKGAAIPGPPSPPNMAPPKVSSWNGNKAFANSFVPQNRGRVVSLDRAQDEGDGYHSSDTNPATDDERRRRSLGKETKSSQSNPPDDGSSGGDSSDGESSYFAKHLPSPKSGRRFSYSSHGSAPPASNFYQHNKGRESDASLSFSDESDDEDLHQSHTSLHASPVVPPRNVPDMQPYPQRITRMHSVGSLVSSTSSDDVQGISAAAAEYEGQKPMLSRSGSDSSQASSAASSDPSIRAELRNVTGMAEVRIPSQQSDRPSGRRKPVQKDGQTSTTPSFPAGFLSPANHPLPSPPPIVPGYAPPSGMPHPRPQSMTSEQVSAWMEAGNAASQLYMPSQNRQYGASSNQLSATMPTTSFASVPTGQSGRSSENSLGTLPFVYSEDDDTDEGLVVNRLSGGHRQPSGAGQAARNISNWENGVNDTRSADEDYGDAPILYDGEQSGKQAKSHDGGGDGKDRGGHGRTSEGGFKVYWQRWIMLMYMSVLNLLSDWTCYSVAPISMLTQEAFGKINPEQLVVVFLGANAIATACEPIILARLGLRRTVLFGALLLMIGSIVKSGGVPPIIQAELETGHDEWRVYLGFFLVGLSQPLYQCTPALLSASWFPERERTMATGVALNANQIGIGFAFIFGTLLVENSEDIPKYFGLLSLISTITFMGTLIQFDDAPPTPPSDTARVMRGTLDVRLPTMETIFQSVRSLGGAGLSNSIRDAVDEARGSGKHSNKSEQAGAEGQARQSKQSNSNGSKRSGSRKDNGNGNRKSSKSSSRKTANKSSTSPQLTRQSSGGSNGGSTRRRTQASARVQTANTDNGFRAGIPGVSSSPSPALPGTSRDAMREVAALERQGRFLHAPAPSPMMPGAVGQQPASSSREGNESPLYEPVVYPNDQPGEHNMASQQIPAGQLPAQHMPMGQIHPQHMPPGYVYQQQMHQGQMHPHHLPPPGYVGFQQWPMGHPAQQMPQGHAPNMPFHPYQYPQYAYYDPRQAYPQQGLYYYQAPLPTQYYGPPQQTPPHLHGYEPPRSALPSAGGIDEGAEPIVTITPHHLDIDIRDDQIILSTRACLSRPGFIHALVSFTVSGIVINTLSTFMDYLVRLNGAGREYVGIVGGSFQFVIMISSLIVGKQTDRTRAYYSVTIGMLVLGAFGLAECGVSLDADRGSDLRWSLVIVAALVGPLQPVSTELGVDVAYPLSENTVLVIQQLFSNLLSACFIPVFKSLKDIGTQMVDTNEAVVNTDKAEIYERPEYTFSFYLLIVLHAAATVFFATFNGRYLRYEHELEKKAQEEQKKMEAAGFQPVGDNSSYPYTDSSDEQEESQGQRQPLLNPVV